MEANAVQPAVSEVVANATTTAADASIEPFPADKAEKVRAQIEFYFSDSNLPRDKCDSVTNLKRASLESFNGCVHFASFL